MSVTAPNLQIELAVNAGCTAITLEDTTDNYGLSGGPTVNNVTTVTILVTPTLVSTTILYTLTISSGTITAATCSLGGATAVDIFAGLSSTVWPFTTASANLFDLLGSYGVTLPTFEDDIFTVNYTIAGIAAGPEAFSFETSNVKEVLCATQCCVDKKMANLDPNCDCYDKEKAAALTVYTYLLQVQSAITLGSYANAAYALNQAKLLCDNADCGC